MSPADPRGELKGRYNVKRWDVSWAAFAWRGAIPTFFPLPFSKWCCCICGGLGEPTRQGGWQKHSLGLDKPAYLGTVTCLQVHMTLQFFSPNVLLALIKSTSFLHKPTCLFLRFLKEVRSLLNWSYVELPSWRGDSIICKLFLPATPGGLAFI